MLYSNQTVRINNKNCTQVTRKRAKAYYKQGRDLYMIACNLRLDNCWQPPLHFSSEGKDPMHLDVTFDALCNSYENYNCDNVRGNRIIFFVEHKNK